MKQSGKSEQKKAEQILLESFRNEETLASALAKIEKNTTVSTQVIAALVARWDVWEMFGGPDD